MKYGYVMTEEEAAKMLHLSRRYLATIRRQGKINGIKVVHRYVYTEEEINRYMETRKRGTSDEIGDGRMGSDWDTNQSD